MQHERHRQHQQPTPIASYPTSKTTKPTSRDTTVTFTSRWSGCASRMPSTNDSSEQQVPNVQRRTRAVFVDDQHQPTTSESHPNNQNIHSIAQAIYEPRQRTTVVDSNSRRTNERPHERRTTNDEQRRRPTTAIFLASFLPRRSLIACIPSSGYVLCVCFKGFVISLTRTLWYYHGYRPGVLRSQIRPRLRLKRLFQKCLNSYYGVTKTLGICRH